MEAELGIAVLATMNAKAHKITVCKNGIVIEHRGFAKMPQGFLRCINYRIADDENTIGGEAFGKQKFSVETDRRQVNAAARLTAPRAELFGVRLQASTFPIVRIHQIPPPRSNVPLPGAF